MTKSDRQRLSKIRLGNKRMEKKVPHLVSAWDETFLLRIIDELMAKKK